MRSPELIIKRPILTEKGTLLKETWDVSQDRQKFFLKRSRLAPAAKVGMRKTLERIADTLES